MERATEKVKNKEFADVDSDAMEGVEGTSHRMSFKDMLMSKQTDEEVDSDEEGSDLGLDDDISSCMKQTVVVKLLIGYRGLHGRLKSLWDREPRGL
ncbi:hypothetical protein Gotri_008514 [Gossypium trilobum]|uniref:Uncharacterized protein n=1 Tax=Gossypium trilobum TaxID=34281 RepID=A0A7J9EJL2_9ROSI|nr:hypothetical protein [Gossypium trilobum]